MHIAIIIAALVTVVAFVVAFFIIRSVFETCRESLRLIAEETGCDITVHKLTLSSRVSGYYNNLPFLCTYTFQTRTSPPTFTVTLPTDVRCVFTVRKKNWFDRCAAAIGLAKTISTGDGAFDRQFSVDTAEKESVDAALSDYQLLEYIIRIFGGQVKQLSFDRQGISIVRKLSPKEIPTPRMFHYFLGMLYKIKVLQDRAPVGYSDVTLDGVTFRHRLGVVMAIFICIGGGLAIAGIELYPPLFPSFKTATIMALPYGITLFIFFNLLNWLMVKCRTDRHVTLAVFFLVSIPAFFLLTIGPAYFANGYMDSSPAVQSQAKVLKTFIKGRGGRKVSFLVDGKPTAGFDRPRGCCKAGEPVRIMVHTGLFGIPWVSKWETIIKEKSMREN